ncbi:class I SAM-dependent methyltransferase [Terrirubrum flagellatum]|uniref:class I SAM-dependent methyltransferase n=1 Tax=Terrirubrum flagellatum TaxID=2895980 RepID=UPI003CC81F85
MLRGVAALTKCPVIGDLATVIAKHPDPELSIAFNHKQIGSKLWLRDALAGSIGPSLRRVLVVGGWFGVLSAMLLDDNRFSLAHATSLDIDPRCAPVARLLNRRAVEAGRFEAVTSDMYLFDYRRPQDGFDCVINTSCEHIPDLRAWLALLPPDAAVVLQSNDYRREPDHVACVDSLADFEAQARLSSVIWRGELPTKNYHRFMLIGRR